MADPNQPRTSSDKRWFSDRVILGAGSLDRRGCNSAKRAASRSDKTNSFFDFQGINLIVAFLESQKAGYPFLPINRILPPKLAGKLLTISNSNLCVLTKKKAFKMGLRR